MSVSVEQDKATKRRVIRFGIDGRWSVQEMGEFFLDLNSLAILLVSLRLSALRTLAQKQGFVTLEDYLQWVTGLVGNNRVLEIKTIHYGSPGIQDIAGAGVIIGHIKEFILKIIETVLDQEKRRLTTKQLELQNAREFIELASQYHLSTEELEFLVAQVNAKQLKLKQLVIEGKLLSVEDHDDRT